MEADCGYCKGMIWFASRGENCVCNNWYCKRCALKNVNCLKCQQPSQKIKTLTTEQEKAIGYRYTCRQCNDCKSVDLNQFKAHYDDCHRKGMKKEQVGKKRKRENEQTKEEKKEKKEEEPVTKKRKIDDGIGETIYPTKKEVQKCVTVHLIPDLSSIVINYLECDNTTLLLEKKKSVLKEKSKVKIPVGRYAGKFLHEVDWRYLVHVSAYSDLGNPYSQTSQKLSKFQKELFKNHSNVILEARSLLQNSYRCLTCQQPLKNNHNGDLLHVSCLKDANSERRDEKEKKAESRAENKTEFRRKQRKNQHIRSRIAQRFKGKK